MSKIEISTDYMYKYRQNMPAQDKDAYAIITIKISDYNSMELTKKVVNRIVDAMKRYIGINADDFEVNKW